MIYKVGDTIALSSLGIMQDHNTVELECEIFEVRHYKEPLGVFKYTAYLCKAIGSDITYMVMIREAGNASDIILYYADSSCDARDVVGALINPNGEDLLDQFNTNVKDDKGGEHEIIWKKAGMGSFFGIEYHDGSLNGIRTVCEFSTQSECGGNPRAFVDWAGDERTGWIEFWVGTEIKQLEVKFIQAK